MGRRWGVPRRETGHLKTEGKGIILGSKTKDVCCKFSNELSRLDQCAGVPEQRTEDQLALTTEM